MVTKKLVENKHFVVLYRTEKRTTITLITNFVTYKVTRLLVERIKVQSSLLIVEKNFLTGKILVISTISLFILLIQVLLLNED